MLTPLDRDRRKCSESEQPSESRELDGTDASARGTISPGFPSKFRDFRCGTDPAFLIHR
jgi:hypothetical protein